LTEQVKRQTKLFVFTDKHKIPIYFSLRTASRKINSEDEY